MTRKEEKYLGSIYDLAGNGEYRPTLWRRFVWTLQEKFQRNRLEIIVTAIVAGTFAVTGFPGVFLFGFEGSAALLFPFGCTMAVICFMAIWTAKKKRANAAESRKTPRNHGCRGNLDICRIQPRFYNRGSLDDDAGEVDRRLKGLNDPGSYSEGT